MHCSPQQGFNLGCFGFFFLVVCGFFFGCVLVLCLLRGVLVGVVFVCLALCFVLVLFGWCCGVVCLGCFFVVLSCCVFLGAGFVWLFFWLFCFCVLGVAVFFCGWLFVCGLLVLCRIIDVLRGGLGSPQPRAARDLGLGREPESNTGGGKGDSYMVPKPEETQST